MTHADLLVLLPLLLPAGAALAALIAIAVRRHHGTAFGLAVSGFAASLAACAAAYPAVPRRVTALAVVDPYALFFLGLIAAAGLVVTLFSYDYWQRRGGEREEYYVLLLLGAVGAMALAVSTHFATLFLGLELLSLGIYVLVAYDRANRAGAEAGLKYLVIAGVSSAFVLFGMALVYAMLGAMELDGITAALRADGAGSPLLVTGLGMIFAGLAFKLALFPFSLWAPDVYEGAPAVVTAFIATISKGAVVALLVRFYTSLLETGSPSFVTLLSLLAVASMLAGNFLALRQRNLKRLLAYSSVAQLGYLLVAFVAGGALGLTAVAFFLAAYFVTTLGAFGVIAALSGARDLDRLEEYRALAWRRPWAAAALTACLFSLAGLPLTAGFLGKFYLVMAGIGTAQWTLVILLALNSGLSLYYYLRVARELYRAPLETTLAPPAISPLCGATLAALVLLLAGLGVYPTPLLRLIEHLVAR